MATLIVGDGNFSFAHALIRAGRLPHSASGLTATSYDSKQVLLQKYGEHAARNVAALEEFGCCVKCSVDGTNLAASFSPGSEFDTIIFQHPLIDANDRRTKAHAGEMAAKEDYIIANRLLVFDFLLSALTLLRRPDGEIKVTVKDVHPYTLWRLGLLAQYAPPLVLKRKEAFINTDYPGYETLNVESDNAFPSEKATCYVFGFRQSTNGHQHLDPLQMAQIPRGKGDICQHMRAYLPFACYECNKFFTSQADMLRHKLSRKHAVLAQLEAKWSKIMHERGRKAEGEQCHIWVDGPVSVADDAHREQEMGERKR